jgi:glucose dehydrogenase
VAQIIHKNCQAEDTGMNTRQQAVLYSLVMLAFTTNVNAQGMSGAPVTDEMLLNPDPADWLMYSRTYDNQRFSPLDQINQQNVAQLRMAWSRGIGPGTQETTPLVHDGIIYVANPKGIVQALDATNGDLIWEYVRPMPDDVEDYIGIDRTRNLALRGDKLFYASPEGFMVALGLQDGELHWETKAHDYKQATEYTSGPSIAGDKVITGRNCDPGPEGRKNCLLQPMMPGPVQRYGALMWPQGRANPVRRPGAANLMAVVPVHRGAIRPATIRNVISFTGALRTRLRTHAMCVMTANRLMSR